jgi:hypothetical protein
MTRYKNLCLADVTVFAYEDSTEYSSVPNIYLCREMGRFVIEAIPLENMGISNGKETAE